MAFSGDTNLGATGSTANNQTTLDLTTVAAIAAGNFVVVVVAADNIASGGDDNACSGVTLGVGGQALTKAIQIANAVAAQSGASCSIWYGVATSGLASGGTIRATFGSASLVDASGLTARKWSITSSAVLIDGTPASLVNNTGADPASLDVTSSGVEGLRVRGIASQVGNNTNLTPTASWTAWANGNSATTGTTGEICARAESRIVTAANAASDPTYVSAIYASAYAVFKEAVAIVMTATPLAVAVDYPSTNLQSAFTLTATALNVVVTGQIANLAKGYKMIADSLAITIGLNPANFLSARTMTALVRNIAVAGQVANLRSLFRMPVDKLSVLFTGQDAQLITRQVVNITMHAQTTQVIVTGNNAGMRARLRSVLQFGVQAPIRKF